MASLYIAEFKELALVQASKGVISAPQGAPIVEQKIAIGGASVASAAFNVDTRFIRVHPDGICSVLQGATPVATADNMRLASGATEYFGVVPGTKIAVITNS